MQSCQHFPVERETRRLRLDLIEAPPAKTILARSRSSTKSPGRSAIAFGVLVFSAISPELVGQGALIGMIGAAALGLVAPLVGRTPGLITAPCAPAAAILTGLAVALVDAGAAIERIPVLLALTALISAILQVIAFRMFDWRALGLLRRRASLMDVSSKTYRLEAERDVLGERGDRAWIYELQGNLFFGTTDQLFSELEPDLHSAHWMLFDMRRVQSMDYTAARLFKQMQDRLQQRGGQLLFSGMPSSLPNRKDLQEYIIHVGLVGDRGRGISIFDTSDEALEWMENAILAEAGVTVLADESLLDLGDIELFRKLDQATLEQLRACMHEHRVSEGEAVFERGDKGDELFLIRRGTVRIILPLKRGKIHHLATFRQGDYFGEMSFLDKRSRSADAVAKTDCGLYLMSRKEFNGWVSENTRLGAKIFARIAQAVSLRLRQTDKELRAIEDR